MAFPSSCSIGKQRGSGFLWQVQDWAGRDLGCYPRTPPAWVFLVSLCRKELGSPNTRHPYPSVEELKNIWIPHAIKMRLTKSKELDVCNWSENEEVKAEELPLGLRGHLHVGLWGRGLRGAWKVLTSTLQLSPTEDPESVYVYDLMATVVHILDSRTGGSLVGHIKVGETYHQRKEVRSPVHGCRWGCCFALAPGSVPDPLLGVSVRSPGAAEAPPVQGRAAGTRFPLFLELVPPLAGTLPASPCTAR